MPTFNYANFKICFPKCSKYCLEFESDGGFFGNVGKPPEMGKPFFVCNTALWVLK